MLETNLAIDPIRERKQLLFLGIGLPLVATALWWFTGVTVFPLVLTGLASLALVGVALHRWIGRDVFLVFSLVSMAVGGVLSRVILFLIYVGPFCVFGSILKLFGMDELRRNVRKNRCRETMFCTAPETPPESFLRQS